ncbi:MAG: HAD family hydrolase [Dehalococcoidia bacterium]
MPVRAVLFDVGGPIDTEVSAEAAIDTAIRARLAAEGVVVTAAEYAAANDWAVASFAPNAYLAIVWRLGGAQVAARVGSVRFPGRTFELRPGIDHLIRELHGRGLLLALAANQPAAVLSDLDAHGVGHYFAHREVSGHHGFRKPDIRLFLRACADLGVEPAECAMVGDRVDNDIVPARLLGMRTVLFRTGRHIAQQPRSIDEVPEAEVWSIDELRSALNALLR